MIVTHLVDQYSSKKLEKDVDDFLGALSDIVLVLAESRNPEMAMWIEHLTTICCPVKAERGVIEDSLEWLKKSNILKSFSRVGASAACCKAAEEHLNTLIARDTVSEQVGGLTVDLERLCERQADLKLVETSEAVQSFVPKLKDLTIGGVGGEPLFLFVFSAVRRMLRAPSASSDVTGVTL